ncbi:MAG TPA: hypothetical protein VFL43_03130 [Variovorax sp.]|nr:hypothetical protein [Variovorax sp.]
MQGIDRLPPGLDRCALFGIRLPLFLRHLGGVAHVALLQRQAAGWKRRQRDAGLAKDLFFPVTGEHGEAEGFYPQSRAKRRPAE